MEPELPSFNGIIQLFGDYSRKVSPKLSHEQSLLVDEALAKIIDLRNITSKIILINSELVEKKKNQSMKLLDLLQEGRKEHPDLDEFLRQNPNLKIDNLTVALSPMSDTFLIDDQDLPKYRELRLMTIQFYQIVHRVLKILSKLPGLKHFRCRPITIVRNQLIEHPEDKSSKILYDSFGFGKITGPVIKALRINGQAGIHEDAGFYPNANAFIHDLEKALINAIEGPI